MKIKNVLFVAAVCVLAALTSCGGSKKGGLPNFGDDELAVATIRYFQCSIADYLSCYHQGYSGCRGAS